MCLPAHATLQVGIHTVCAWSAWERSTQSRLSRGSTARIVAASTAYASLPEALFEQMDRVAGMKTGESLSSSFPIRSSARSLGSEAHPAVSSPQREGDAPPVFLRGGGHGGVDELS